MVWQENPTNCELAENYFYDAVDEMAVSEIPADVANHIEHCDACQKRIEELKQILHQEMEKPCDPLPKALEWHFTKIGKPMGCHDVKPFLPAMAIPEIAIHIPTPITVHLDHCKSCAESLDQIRKWKLDSSQYMRLSAFLSQNQNDQQTHCLSFPENIASAAHMDFSEMDSTAKNHICLPPDSWNSLHMQKTEMQQKASSGSRKHHFSCRNVQTADLFDYVLSSGLEPENDTKEKLRPALTSHLRECVICHEAMQKLHYEIHSLKKLNSGVVTIFHVKSQDTSEATKEKQGIYSDWPIHVEVRTPHAVMPEKQPVSSPGKIPWHRAGVSMNTLHRIFKPLFKPAAVAAMFLVAFSLFLHMSSPAQGLDPVYDAMKNVNQIYIARYVPQSSEKPIQEQWLSASTGMYLSKTKTDEILQNHSEKLIQSKNIRTGEIESVSMPDEVANRFQKSFLLTISRLLPFNRLSQAPQDAQWNLLPADPSMPNMQVYELSWKDPRTVGESIYRKWRCYVDSQNNRMTRGEWYKKLENQSDFTLEYYTVIEYPQEQDILSRIQSEF